jgi:hypothetical protein
MLQESGSAASREISSTLHGINRAAVAKTAFCDRILVHWIDRFIGKMDCLQADHGSETSVMHSMNKVVKSLEHQLREKAAEKDERIEELLMEIDDLNAELRV